MLKPIRIQYENFSVEEEISEVKKTSSMAGAVVTFTGSVRDFSDGRGVRAIEFDEYREMALMAMEKLRCDAVSQFKVLDVRIIHRVGRIAAGEDIVLIVAAAEHRREAFEAAHWCIDTLKKNVPLWKKEMLKEGSEWVVPQPS